MSVCDAAQQWSHCSTVTMTAHVLLLLLLFLLATLGFSPGLRPDGQSDVWTEGRQREGQTEGQSSCEKFGQCQTHRLVVKRGSSVLLPCNLSSPTPSNVSWVKVHETLLVHISSEGHVGFVEPREGRMKTFPNGAAEGNFSIRVDQLRPSDLGWYCCQHGQRCVQVHLQESSVRVKSQLLWVSIGVAPVVFILLLVGYFRYTKQSRKDVTSGETPGQPTQESHAGEDNLVYENDSHCPAYRQAMANQSHGQAGVMSMAPPTHSTAGASPNQNQVSRERMESHRRKWRFHTEMFNRLRPASFSRHFYANQTELSPNNKQGEQTRQQRELKYNNPVYNWDA